MPYIAIKSFPKDQATKEAVVEKINEIFLEVWGCPQEAITISIENVTPPRSLGSGRKIRCSQRNCLPMFPPAVPI